MGTHDNDMADLISMSVSDLTLLSFPDLTSMSFPGLTRESTFYDRLSSQGETMTKKRKHDNDKIR